MGEFSMSHVLIFTLILLVFFGPSRLPALGQSLGKAIRGFKDGLNEVEKEMQTTKQSVESNPTSETKTQVVKTETEQTDKQKQNNS